MATEMELKRHAGLLDRMAQALGIDLQEAAIGGRVSIDELTDAVLRCTDCSQPDHCEHWLRTAAPVAATEERRQPGYCRNAELLQRLRASPER